jgi:ATP-binding cassette subfamily B protein
MDQIIKKKNITFFQVFKKIIGYISLKRKFQFFFLVILSLVVSSMEVLSIGSVYPLIKIISDPNQILTNNDYAKILQYLNITTSKELIVTSSFVFGIIAFLTGCIRLLLIYVNLRLSLIFSYEIYLLYYSNVLHQSYEYHLSQNSSEILSTITSKITNVSTAFINFFTIITSSIIISSIILILFLINQYITTYVIFIFLFFYSFFTLLFNLKLNKNSKNITNNQDLTVKVVQESLGGIRDIILDKSQNYFIDIYRNSIYKVQKYISQNIFLAQSPRFILEAFGLILIAVFVIIISEKSLLRFNEFLPILGSLVLGAQRIFPLANQIYQSNTSNKSIVYSLFDIIKFLEKQPQPSFFINQNKNFNFKKLITLKNLRFSYKNDNFYVFKDLNFEIPKGSKVAITGSSGCGKSTLLDLVMGLLKPSGGEILVDGNSINYNLNSWQSKIAHVPQSIYLLDGTITENIAFGVKKENIDLVKVKNVAKVAHIHDFIESKKLGYNELAGERGIQLSGGQRQRIGIARALYKDAELLILDEATSALDYDTEKLIIDAIDNLGKNKTILIVTHRLFSIQNCNFSINLNK